MYKSHWTFIGFFYIYRSIYMYIIRISIAFVHIYIARRERRGAGVETQKNVRGEIGGWGRVPFNETYAPSLSTIYNGA